MTRNTSSNPSRLIESAADSMKWPNTQRSGHTTAASAGSNGGSKPPQFLKEGDIARIEADKLGFIENRVAAEKAVCIIE